MYCSVIDIGSNTIRMVVYNVKENKYLKVFDEKNALGILNYIENGRLTEDGIQSLIDILNNMHENILLMNCSTCWCFSTASLRNISNTQEVISRVNEETSIEVHPLTGKQEAEYDFISLKSVIKNTHFIGCDLGGGSLQIVQCNDQKLENSSSLAIGSLRMYRDFVEGFFPTEKECETIKAYVIDQLKPYKFIKKHNEDTLYIMGGTARAIVKLYRALINSDQAIHGSVLTIEQLEIMKNTISNLGIEGVKVISKVLPERVLTIIPGLIVILTLAKQMNVNCVVIAKKSIRDGVVIKHMMKGDYNDKRKI